MPVHPNAGSIPLTGVPTVDASQLPQFPTPDPGVDNHYQQAFDETFPGGGGKQAKPGYPLGTFDTLPPAPVVVVPESAPAPTLPSWQDLREDPAYLAQEPYQRIRDAQLLFDSTVANTPEFDQMSDDDKATLLRDFQASIPVDRDVYHSIKRALFRGVDTFVANLLAAGQGAADAVGAEDVAKFLSWERYFLRAEAQKEVSPPEYRPIYQDPSQLLKPGYVAEQVAGAVPSIAAFTATRNPIAAGALAGIDSFGTAYETFIHKGLSTKEALARALVAGIGSGALNFVFFDQLWGKGFSGNLIMRALKAGGMMTALNQAEIIPTLTSQLGEVTGEEAVQQVLLNLDGILPSAVTGGLLGAGHRRAKTPGTPTPSTSDGAVPPPSSAGRAATDIWNSPLKPGDLSRPGLRDLKGPGPEGPTGGDPRTDTQLDFLADGMGLDNLGRPRAGIKEVVQTTPVEGGQMDMFTFGKSESTRDAQEAAAAAEIAERNKVTDAPDKPVIDTTPLQQVLVDKIEKGEAVRFAYRKRDGKTLIVTSTPTNMTRTNKGGRTERLFVMDPKAADQGQTGRWYFEDRMTVDPSYSAEKAAEIPKESKPHKKKSPTKAETRDRVAGKKRKVAAPTQKMPPPVQPAGETPAAAADPQAILTEHASTYSVVSGENFKLLDKSVRKVGNKFKTAYKQLQAALGKGNPKLIVSNMQRLQDAAAALNTAFGAKAGMLPAPAAIEGVPPTQKTPASTPPSPRGRRGKQASAPTTPAEVPMAQAALGLGDFKVGKAVGEMSTAELKAEITKYESVPEAELGKPENVSIRDRLRRMKNRLQRVQAGATETAISTAVPETAPRLTSYADVWGADLVEKFEGIEADKTRHPDAPITIADIKGFVRKLDDFRKGILQSSAFESVLEGPGAKFADQWMSDIGKAGAGIADAMKAITLAGKAADPKALLEIVDAKVTDAKHLAHGIFSTVAYLHINDANTATGLTGKTVDTGNIAPRARRAASRVRTAAVAEEATTESGLAPGTKTLEMRTAPPRVNRKLGEVVESGSTDDAFLRDLHQRDLLDGRNSTVEADGRLQYVKGVPGIAARWARAVMDKVGISNKLLIRTGVLDPSTMGQQDALSDGTILVTVNQSLMRSRTLSGYTFDGTARLEHTIAHEIGHGIVTTLVNNAPIEVRAAIQAEHAAWLRKVNGMTLEELSKSTLLHEGTSLALMVKNAAKGQKGLTIDEFRAVLEAETTNPKSNELLQLHAKETLKGLDYATSLDEFLANSVEARTTAEYQPGPPSVFTAFVDKIHQIWQTIYQALTGTSPDSATFLKFLRDAHGNKARYYNTMRGNQFALDVSDLRAAPNERRADDPAHLRQIAFLEQQLEALPAMRSGQSTDAVRQRFEAKLQELYGQVGFYGKRGDQASNYRQHLDRLAVELAEIQRRADRGELDPIAVVEARNKLYASQARSPYAEQQAHDYEAENAILANNAEHIRASQLVQKSKAMASWMKDIGIRILDSVSVEAKYRRIGQAEVGRKVKNFHTTVSNTQQEGFGIVHNLLRQLGYDQQASSDAVWYFQDERDMAHLKQADPARYERLRPAFETLDHLQHDAQVRRVEAGIADDNQTTIFSNDGKKHKTVTGFQAHVMQQIDVDQAIYTKGLAWDREALRKAANNPERAAKLRERIATTEAWLAENESIRDAAYNMNYTHLPTSWLAEEMTSSNPEARKYVMRYIARSFKPAFGTARPRKNLTLRDLVEIRDPKTGKPFFQRSDFNLGNVIMSYMTRLGRDLGMADVLQAAKKAGMARPLSESEFLNRDVAEPTASDEAANLSEMPLGSSPALGSQRWMIHDLLHNWLNNEVSMNRNDYTGPLAGLWRGMATMKNAAFYNPIILPLYNTVQATWAGTIWRRGSWTAMKEAYREVNTRGVIYQEAARLGFNSKPFAESHRSIRDHLAYMQRTNRGLYEYVASTVPTHYLGDILTASQSLAWKFEEVGRMQGYIMLRKHRGFTAEDAAQQVALYFGDYASVPQTTRMFLNKIFFTPTFKIAMAKQHYRMFRDAGKMAAAIVKGRTGDLSKVQVQNGVALMWLGMATFLTDQLFHIWGFETDRYGWKYKKSVETPNGPKELIMTMSNPNNAFSKYGFRTADAFAPGNTNIPMSLWRSNNWELHPAWRLFQGMLTNTDEQGDQIYNPFDSFTHQTADKSWYATSRAIPLLKWAQEVLLPQTSKSASEAKRIVAQEVPAVWLPVVWPTTFSYMRAPEVQRKADAVKRLIQQYRTQFNKDIRAADTTEQVQDVLRDYQARTVNLNERVQEILAK